MKPLKCVAIDDEPLALSKLGSYIERTPSLRLVALCESPLEALSVIADNEIDALFLDINMPDMNGFQLLEQLPYRPLTVFTTAYSEYAVDSYRFAGVDYLVKPFVFITFQRAVTRLVKYHSFISAGKDDPQSPQPVPPRGATPPARQSIYVKVDYRYVNVRLDDIEYIKGMNEYVQIFVRDRRPLMSHVSMRQILETLPPQFLQVHRSFIVNMDRVSQVERMSIVTATATRLAVSDSYRQSLLDYLVANSPSRRQ